MDAVVHQVRRCLRHAADGEAGRGRQDQIISGKLKAVDYTVVNACN